jgi:hypothetical protein
MSGLSCAHMVDGEYTSDIHHYSKRKSVNGRLCSRDLFHDLDGPDALGPFTVIGLVWKRFQLSTLLTSVGRQALDTRPRSDLVGSHYLLVGCKIAPIRHP